METHGKIGMARIMVGHICVSHNVGMKHKTPRLTIEKDMMRIVIGYDGTILIVVIQL